jgi:plastocyanin
VQGDNPFAVSQLWITGAIVWIIGALVLFIFRALRLISGKRERPIRSLAATFLGLTIFAFFIVLLIWGSVFNPNIGMTRTSFMRTTVSIDNGTTVHFHNPADGATQILCVGVNQRCRAGDSDPSQLDRGLVIQPGQTVNVAFYADGTYQITSKTTPNMNLTIDVTTPDNSGGD